MPTETGAGVLDLVNFRDLGGLPTTDGRETARGMVFRSESLATISSRDGEVLCQRHGIRNVIDLRSAREVDGQRPAWTNRAGVEYTNLPFSDGFDEVKDNLSENELAALVPSKYLSYLDRAKANIVAALNSISDAAAQSLPTIFACTYGKDRTGVLTAILLELLCVDRRTIVDDYAATAAAMGTLMARMKDDPLHGPRIGQVPVAVYEARRHYAESFLQGLDERGGADSWAIQAGFEKTSIDQLRNVLISTSPIETQSGVTVAPPSHTKENHVT